MFSCLDRSERAQMAALPIEEKADELIQEERAIGEVQLEQLPRATGEQRLMRELTAAMVELQELL